MNVLKGSDMRIPAFSWCNSIEDGALEQIENISNLPFAFHHVAVMPDCHMGYGMPIGGVLATSNDTVVPNAVGVDIGCGMLACKTSITEKPDKETVKKLISEMRKIIPVGFSHHKDFQLWSGFYFVPDIPIIEKEITSARKQLGTLGGGNHFIELQWGSDGKLWFMIHSGSRNIGYKIANTYHTIAKRLCQEYYSDLPTLDLAFLPVNSFYGNEYLEGMKFAFDFAKASRNNMGNRVFSILESELNANVVKVIDVHHNYVRMEHHFGRNVMVHRKGATSAKLDEYGIIPGSQGTNSYIVSGLGNKESFCSCSHGAGRAMSRTKARNELVLDDAIKKLDDKGIVHSIRNINDLDEAEGAYKNIDEVMEAQNDLVKIEVELTPLGGLKASSKPRRKK